MREYNAFSLTTALKPSDTPKTYSQPTTTSPLASSANANVSGDVGKTQWSKMFNGMTKDRRIEVIGKAIQQVQESNYRGLRKGPLVAELRRGLTGVLPTSDSAKFFLMQAAFDCGYQYMFRADRWHWPQRHSGVLPSTITKWTVLKPDGSITLETPKQGDSVGVENPWRPLKARGAYKKPELMEMVRILVGEVPPKAKADELYAMLVGKLQPLGQP